MPQQNKVGYVTRPKGTAVVLASLLVTASLSAIWQDTEARSIQARTVSTPSSTEGVFRRARLFLKDEEWQKAEAGFRKFLEERPNHPESDAALYWLAFSLTKQHRLRESAETLAALINGFPDSPWAADARALRAEIAPRLGNTAIIRESLSSADVEEKLAALTSLFEAQPEDAARIAIEIYNDPHSRPALKENLIVLMGKFANRQTTSFLLHVIGSESAQRPRKLAVLSLRNTDDYTALEALENIALNDADKIISVAATFIITQSKSSQAGQILVRIVERSGSLDVQREAIFGLGRVAPDPSAELLKLFDNKKEIDARREILFALSRLPDKKGFSALASIAGSEGDSGLRREALNLLGQQEESAAALSALYDGERDPDLKREILFTLGKLRARSAVAKLIDIARNDSSPEMQKEAMVLLRKSTSKTARRFLQEIDK